jgi:KDO2-lipid IV(A) lauroyltransferase
MPVTTLFQREFLKPKYWLVWLGISFIKMLCLLPLRVRWRFGEWLGILGHTLARKRRHIVATNLKLCFPELTEQENKNLVFENFKSSGIGIIETALVWFSAPKRFEGIVDIDGLSNLQQAHSQGQGVLLLGMHLSTLDFCGAVLGTRQPFDVMYRRNKNKLLEAIMTRGREKNFDAAIERSNVRQVIRRLKQGAVVWYGPDQDYGRKHSVFAPFFSQNAATITATARIAEITDSPVILFSHYRDLSTGRYRIVLSEPLEGYPSGDELNDCTRINGLIEQAIRTHPEQYWWLHRRFKTTPDRGPRPYDRVLA